MGNDHLPLAIVALQAAGAVGVASGLLLVDAAHAIAALLAGAVVVLPNGYFVLRARAERSPGRLLAYGVMRFVLTTTLMALAFAAFKPAPLGFFSAFLLMQAMYVAGPCLLAARPGQPANAVEPDVGRP